jgi:hypothetical protein
VAKVELCSNSDRMTLPVTLGNGRRIQMRVEPNEAFFDDEGYVRLFSVRYNDGVVGNYKLLPKNQTEDAVLRFVRAFLVPFGLTIASNAIFAGDTIVYNLCQELFERGGQHFIDDIFERYSISHSAYYEVVTGEQVITHAVQLQLR